MTTTPIESPHAAELTAAATELFEGLCRVLMDDRGVHLETAITAAGHLAGAALLDCAGVDLSGFEPGTYVLVPEVDETGPLLVETLYDLCDRGGADPEAPMPADVPEGNRPLRDYADLMRTCAPMFEKVIERWRVPTDLRPFVAARAAARLILAGRQNLDPAVGKTLATHAIVRAAKTVPARPAAGARAEARV
jgi:hypothetical protein